MAKPTATTFFPAKSSADKTRIQSMLDKLAAGADRSVVLSEATALGAQMSGDDRAQLMGIVYQQLADR